MEQLKLIKLVVDRIGKLGIPYFITGSIASSYYGIPRYTHDIDVVVTISQQNSVEIVRLFSREGYIPRDCVARNQVIGYIWESLSSDFLVGQ